MENNQIRELHPRTKIVDNRTGESLYYLSFPIDSAYVLCDDGQHTIFLPPNRIELK
jgi:hypothetical protein